MTVTKRLRTFRELHALKQQIDHRLYTDMAAREHTLNERAHQIAYQSLDNPSSTEQFTADCNERAAIEHTRGRLRAAQWAIDSLLANGWYDGPRYNDKPHTPAPNAPTWAYIDEALPEPDYAAPSEGEQLLRFFAASTTG